MQAAREQVLEATLQWYTDQGVEWLCTDEVQNRTIVYQTPSLQKSQALPAPPNKPILGTSEASAEAIRLAKEAKTLEDLKKAVADFKGLSIQKTATNMVFSDGSPEARIMLIGEAPGADEDRQGKPFVGVSGQLLDRILKSINLDRYAENLENSIYISNILNWRPPGNRNPTPAEIEISLPFIEKHIMLIQPEILILCGGVSAKALLPGEQSVSRLRKVWHTYKPKTQALGYTGSGISAMVTYHPAYLLRTPVQKKAVWADMLMLKDKMN